MSTTSSSSSSSPAACTRVGGRRLRHPGDLGVDVLDEAEVDGPAGAQARDRERLDEVLVAHTARRERQAVVVVGPGGDVEVPGAVGHRGREQPVHGRLRARRARVRDAAVARLEADEAGEAGRDPRRAAAVAGGGHGHEPAATAAALPPDDRRACGSRSHGLRVMPHAFVLVKLSVPNSGAAVLPIGTPPAARRRATWIESAATGPRPL